jgi:hypothetical protein
VPFVLACFQASAAPRLENPDLDAKDALFGLATQITIAVFSSSDMDKIMRCFAFD